MLISLLIHAHTLRSQAFTPAWSRIGWHKLTYQYTKGITILAAFGLQRTGKKSSAQLVASSLVADLLTSSQKASCSKPDHISWRAIMTLRSYGVRVASALRRDTKQQSTEATNMAVVVHSTLALSKVENECWVHGIHPVVELEIKTDVAKGLLSQIAGSRVCSMCNFHCTSTSTLRDEKVKSIQELQGGGAKIWKTCEAQLDVDCRLIVVRTRISRVATRSLFVMINDINICDVPCWTEILTCGIFPGPRR